ncbi:MAG TPA: Lcl C-terminal domain-containing protein [Candidatus Wunengus sp. YC63]|uniref:Lcl C-terminal domain-containing protein n=1 Tax=unclassified Candidatus Wunengus TaxID=3367695 RepID=UPI0040272905
MIAPFLAYSGHLDNTVVPTAADSGALNRKTFSERNSADRWGLITGTQAQNIVQSSVQKTCQTTSYTTGDDANSDKGVASPSPRFTDNGNGAITDNLTGLIWLQNANVVGARTWADALTDVENLNSDGMMNGISAGDTSNGGSHQKDWRLPNRNELASLTDSSNNNPALPSGYSSFFSGVQSDSYWSSDTLKGGIAYAWIVNMSDHGIMDTAHKTETCYVWPVRAGKK